MREITLGGILIRTEKVPGSKKLRPVYHVPNGMSGDLFGAFKEKYQEQIEMFLKRSQNG